MLSANSLRAALPQGFLTLVLFISPPSAEAQSSNATSSGQARVVRITQLTNDAPFFTRPVWSPNSQWLAFGRESMGGIEVARRDGTGRKTVTTDPGSGYKFAWSPDSLQIAYRASQYQSNTATFIIKSVEVASGRIVELSKPTAEVQPPVWACANTSNRVSFLSGTNRVNTPWRVVGGKPDRAPTRNQDLLLYTDQGQVWSCGPAGLRKLTEAGGMEPVWSPDWSQIVYSQMGMLTIMQPDGSKKRALTKGHHPSWSPDGRRLVYDITSDDGHQILTSDLCLINADGTEQARLTNTPDILESEPAWSPDGKCIACRTENSGWILLLWLE